MRITKSWLRGQKRSLYTRVLELCSLGATGKIADEYFRCFPHAVGMVPTDHTDWHKVRELLHDSISRALPDHLTD